MAMRAAVFGFALSGLTATAAAQTVSVPKNWTPITRTGQGQPCP
jgi:hypothetical protein